jgi:hypothetical protein
VWLCGLVPFEQAARILIEVGQIQTSGSSTWRLTDRWTAKMQSIERLSIAAAQSLPCTYRCQGEQPQTGKRMGASMDGVMINVRDEGWKETKVGCVYELGTRRGKDPVTKEETETSCAAESSYVAHLGRPKVFGQTLWAEARRRGWTTALETQIMGDGAKWIWNLAGEHFYSSYQTVDFYHAVEHLATAARLLHGEGTRAATRWLNAQRKTLHLGDVDGVISAINRAARKKPAVTRGFSRESGYFKNNRNRMNYLEMRSDGWLLGSGTVESGAKQIKMRMAGPGMKWSRTGAQGLLLLRTQIMSDRFDAAWTSAYHLPPN